MSRTIAIGGFMGVGKSTAGRLLSQRLCLPFVDLDAAIEGHCGLSVRQIFLEHGEAYFRGVEEKVLKGLLDGPPIVLSLGGGTLHQSGCLEPLQARALIVVLWMPIEAIQERIGSDDSTRPLWSESAALFEDREQGYRDAGTLLNVNDLAPSEVADALERVVACA